MTSKFTAREIYTLIVLFYVNMLNYMDRYTIAGLLSYFKTEFGIGDDLCGLLQTGFIVSYTMAAPVLGFAGDRCSRRGLMMLSVLVWSGATAAGSFAPNYNVLFVSRLIVGVGEAGFCALAPTVICDLTYDEHRKHALTFFYVAIPIGSGMGFGVGSGAAYYLGHWSWGLRVTPAFGAIALFLMYFMKDPVRGEKERLAEGVPLQSKKTNYVSDVRGLMRNHSYLLSTVGFTTVTFAIGAMTWWGPHFLHAGFQLIEGRETKRIDEVGTEVGVLAVTAGMIGVPVGGIVAAKLTKKYPRADPLMCGTVIISGIPIIILLMILADKSVVGTYVTIFAGQCFMNSCWTVVADILLTVVRPESRSTAESLQIACGHALGDAGSPYLVGLIAEYYKRNMEANASDSKARIEFKAMSLAFYSIVVMQFVGGLLFLVDYFYIVEDREKVRFSIAQSAV